MGQTGDHGATGATGPTGDHGSWRTGSNAIGAAEIASNINTASLVVTGSGSSLPAGSETVSLRRSGTGSIDLVNVTLNVWGGA